MEVSPPRYFRPLRPRDQAPACFRPVVSTTTCTLALWAGDRPLGSLCTRPHRPNGFISSPILVENLRLVFYQIFPFWCMHGQRTPHLCFTINASSGLCYAMGHQRSSLGAIPEAPTPGPRAYKMVKQHKTRPCSAILACLEPRWSCLLAVPHSLLHNNTPSEPASHDSRDTTVIESCRVA